MIESFVQSLFSWLALPQVGLPAVFIIAFISATVLPMGSEPVVFATIKASPDAFWLVIACATLGNTLGGIVDYWLGYGAKQAFAKERETRWFRWLAHYGAKTMLLSWLPVVGDPLCTLAGWLKLPFWPCVLYMAIGKLARYLTMTWLLLAVPDAWWQRLGQMLF
ncbi:YqaA family protein [Massilia sp. W12]|uniref:YqaA family protein n=1 Tax=Massilia sp. W12 TaxID=3126507 RepID=UPI0030CAAA8D